MYFCAVLVACGLLTYHAFLYLFQASARVDDPYGMLSRPRPYWTLFYGFLVHVVALKKGVRHSHFLGSSYVAVNGSKTGIFFSGKLAAVLISLSSAFRHVGTGASLHSQMATTSFIGLGLFRDPQEQ